MSRFPKNQAQIAALAKQPEETELEYSVIAINKSGGSQANNTVMVVF